MTALASGLVHIEINRGDGSLRCFLGGRSGLAMRAIHLLGSVEQHERWLPGMARVEQTGAVALTEPPHGLDSVALSRTAR
jgi:glutaryl-CoA dehydrogenase